MSLSPRFSAAILLSLLGSTAVAQNAAKPVPPAPAAAAKPEPTLKPGSPAPELRVEKFLKGTPITGFEKGKIYVVEFWATWCGPCIMSIPHLSELQRQYKDKGLTICGINIWEDKEYSESTLGKAAAFVESRGNGMAYTVAFDGAAKFMDSNWMKPAGRNGIPSAFLVDQSGTIAWIGHPMHLDMVIDEVVTEKWDIEKGPERIKAATKSFQDAGAKYQEGVAAGDSAWAEATKLYPVMGKGKSGEKFRALVKANHTTEAQVFGAEIVQSAQRAKDPSPIMEVFNTLESAPNRSDALKSLLLAAAQANFDLANQQNSGPHVIMARAYFAIGDTEKAHASVAKALELEKPEVRPRLEAWLKEIEEKAGAK